MAKYGDGVVDEVFLIASYEEEFGSVDRHNAPDILQQMVYDVSTALCDASWLALIEFLIWDEMQSSTPKYFKPEQLDEFRKLSQIWGAWLVWEDRYKIRFIGLEEWEQLYQQWIDAGRRNHLES